MLFGNWNEEFYILSFLNARWWAAWYFLPTPTPCGHHGLLWSDIYSATIYFLSFCNYLSKVILNENIQASVFYQAFSKMRFISTRKLSVWSCHFEVSKTFKICKLPYWTPSLYLRNCFNFVQNDNTTMYNPTQ